VLLTVVTIVGKDLKYSKLGLEHWKLGDAFPISGEPGSSRSQQPLDGQVETDGGLEHAERTGQTLMLCWMFSP
jgi:hypothetical protein